MAQTRQNVASNEKKVQGIVDRLRQALLLIDEVGEWPDFGARLQGLIDDINERSV